MMSSYGPLIDPDVLRKNVNGIVSGFSPASATWDRKLVIWATTRHGAVIGDTSSRSAGGTRPSVAAAASIAGRSANSSLVVAAWVSICAAPVGVCTHQASAVRRTEMLMIWLLSRGRGGGSGRIRFRGGGRSPWTAA